MIFTSPDVPHRHTALGQILFRFRDRIAAEMEDGGSKYCVRPADRQRLVEMLECSRTSGSDNRNWNRLDDGAQELQVVPALCAVRVHTGE